jgi:ATP-dependent protease HslVU (ClpYQ) peptidase subunit
MTVVVGFLCSDGVVIAADSMITPAMGNLSVGHHHGQKIFARNGHQIFAFAGDQGVAMRALYVVEQTVPDPTTQAHPINYAHAIWAAANGLFNQTGLNVMQINLNNLLAFNFNNMHQCCIFGSGGGYQPMLLDPNNFYAAIGSGKQFADPFLRFVADTFCATGRPTVSEARFLAAWVVQHVIETNPGGVAGPIRMAVLARDAGGALVATELGTDDVQEHLQAVKEAGDVLRAWRAGTGVFAKLAASVPTPGRGLSKAAKAAPAKKK